MSGISNYAKDRVANALNNTVSLPTTVYVGLVTIEPFSYMTGSVISEPPSGTGYSRQSFAMNGTNWNAASNGSITNKVAVIFTTNAFATWGAAVAWVICTASTGGELLWWGTFDQTAVIDTGSTVSIPVNGMQITVSGPN